MLRKTRSMLRLWLPAVLCAAGLASAPAFGGDRGSIQIVAVAPAFCHAAPLSDRVSGHAPALLGGMTPIGALGRTCNMAEDVQVTAHVSNLNGGTLQIGGQNVAVGPGGQALLSAAQLAQAADWGLVHAAPADPAAPVTLELTIVAN
jgi:hypothetical protein